MIEVFDGYLCISKTNACIYTEEDFIDGMPPCCNCPNCIAVEQLAEITGIAGKDFS